MASMGQLDEEKRRARRIIATAALTAVAVALLVLSGGSGRVGATPPAAGPSYQAADQQAPSDAAEAEETAAAEAPMELPVMSLGPDGLPAAAQIGASEMPLSGARQPIVSSDLEDHTSGAVRQRMFKSRRAVEVIDPRQFRR